MLHLICSKSGAAISSAIAAKYCYTSSITGRPPDVASATIICRFRYFLVRRSEILESLAAIEHGNDNDYHFSLPHFVVRFI